MNLNFQKIAIIKHQKYIFLTKYINIHEYKYIIVTYS